MRHGILYGAVALSLSLPSRTVSEQGTALIKVKGVRQERKVTDDMELAERQSRDVMQH